MTRDEAQAVIKLATCILIEEKNMLTLAPDEYALLSGESYNASNSAVSVAVHKFTVQLDYVKHRLYLAATFLEQSAVASKE